MKKNTPLKTTAFIVLSFVLVLACTKDFENIIDDSFDFSFTADHDEDIFVFEATKTDFLLQPERVVSTVSYFMKYNLVNGNGYFVNSENDTIRENDTIMVKNLNLSFNYMALDTINHRIKVLAWDSNQLEKELELEFYPKYASFDFLLNKGSEDLTINSKNTLNATLIRDKETSGNDDLSPNEFKITYHLENGTGQLFVGDTSYEQGESFILPKGTIELDYLPETLGEHTIIMTSVASDGATITRTLVLTVENVNFSFRSTASASQVELNTNLSINIDLQSQDENSEVNYEITHSFSLDSESFGTVRDQNGGVMNPGSNRQIEPGNYNYTFKGEELGYQKIYFDILDSNGQTKRDSVEIDVANIPFTFSGNAESNQVFVNQRTQLNFNARSQGNTTNIDYFLTYNIIRGNGKVTAVNGNNIQNNTDHHVELGNFSLFYTPESLEDHAIEFWMTDSFGQRVAPVTVDLTAKHLDLEFSASVNENDVLVGQRAAILLSLIEKGDYDGVTYEMSYFITGGDGTLFNGNSALVPSQFFTVVPSSFSYDFVGSQPGTYEVTFLLRDSNGQQLPPEKITIVVGNNDFNVTMTPQKTTEFSNVPVNIVVDIDEIPEGTGDTYEAFFSSSKNGSITSNGSSYGPGEKFALVPGVNIISYTGLEHGEHNLVLSIKSGSNETKTPDTKITFEQVDYTFSGGTQSSTISIGETTALNFNITESIGNSNYTLRFTMNGNGIIRDGNGDPVGPGIINTIPTGNFNWSFEGTTKDDVDLLFISRNETGLEKEVPISITVKQKDFNFTSSAPIPSAFTGETLEVNHTIEEIGIGGDTYSMSFSSGNNSGTFEYDGQVYSAGETFDVPVESFQGIYTGLSEGNHNIVFTVRSSSNVPKEQSLDLDYADYQEPFTITVSQSSGIRLEGEPFNIAVIVDANGTHDPSVTYSMKFSFSGNRAGYFIFQGQRYDEGENVPLNYGSSNMIFYPNTQETFTITIDAENSTGETAGDETFVDTIRKPVAQVKGEKHNVNCGGFNGCDYQVRIYTCFDIGCSEAYSGATLNQVEIRIYNRSARRWDTRLFNYSEAVGSGVDRYFLMEEEPRESRLKYLDQNFEVRVRDTNNQWSERVSGRVIRV